MGQSPAVAIAGLEVEISDPISARDMIIEMGKRGVAADVHLVNAYTVALAAESGDYRDAMSGRSINFADGKPLSLFLKRYSEDAEQVRGPSLFRDVLDAGRQVNLRHFLMGGAPEVLAALQEAIAESYEGCCIAGAISPPFRTLSEPEWAEIYNLIALSEPDVVWIGLGTPKQDYVCKRIAEDLGLLTVAVGAAFDFVAGAKPEAPQFARRLGLEWLHRLVAEPRRLWRRYLFGNVRFIREVVLALGREARSD